MGDGVRRRRRRKNVQKKAVPLTKIEDVPDELLELVFIRLTSPPDIIRAACTCRCWRRVIRGSSVSYVVGHYQVDERLHGRLPPGLNPVFIPSPSPSPWVDIIAARNLGLDFLPRQFGDFIWELTDVRGGLLLLLDSKHGSALVICDPLARRYRMIPRSAWFHRREFMGAFLLDGEDASASISLSNFGVTCAVCSVGVGLGIARACMFSSITNRWTSGGAPGCIVRGLRGYIRFGGCSDDGSTAYWTDGGVGILIALDKEAGELSSSVMSDKVEFDALRDKRHEPEYAYELTWPPMMRACSS
jgi:hypothetical protein